jgi:tetratricopeptide (TPR) repeat protein
MVDANFLLLRRNSSNPTSESPFELPTKSISKYLKSGDLDSALSLLSSVVASTPSNNFSEDSRARLFICTSIKSFSDKLSPSLESDDLDSAISVLKHLDRILGHLPSNLYAAQKCDILNILACAHRKTGKTQAAKKNLEAALDLVAYIREANADVASIYLNMCAILSNLNRHKDALEYGRTAVTIAEEVFNRHRNLSDEKARNNLITILAVGYHNLGVEEEHLRNYESSLEWYENAVKFLSNHGGAKQAVLLKEFRRSYSEVSKILQKSSKKSGKTDKIVKKQSVRSGLSHKSSVKSSSRVVSTDKFQKPNIQDYYRKENSVPVLNQFQIKPHDLSSSSNECLDSDTEADIKELTKLGLINHLHPYSKSKSSSNFPSKKTGSHPLIKTGISASTSKISTPVLTEDNCVELSFNQGIYDTADNQTFKTINKVTRYSDTPSKVSDSDIVMRSQRIMHGYNKLGEESSVEVLERLPYITKKSKNSALEIQKTSRAKKVEKEILNKKKVKNPVFVAVSREGESENSNKGQVSFRVDRVSSIESKPSRLDTDGTNSHDSKPHHSEIISEPHDETFAVSDLKIETQPLVISSIIPHPEPTVKPSSTLNLDSDLCTYRSDKLPEDEYVKNLVHTYTNQPVDRKLTLNSQDSLRTETTTFRSTKQIPVPVPLHVSVPVPVISPRTLESAAIKIQKHYRGWQARFKLSLLKKSRQNKKLVYRCGKKLENKYSIISIYSSGNKYIITMVDSEHPEREHTLELNDCLNIDPKYISNKLNYDTNHGLYLNPDLIKGEEQEAELKIIKKHMKSIDKQAYLLTFYLSTQGQINLKVLNTISKEEISVWLEGSYLNKSEEDILIELELKIIPSILIQNSTLLFKPLDPPQEEPKSSSSIIVQAHSKRQESEPKIQKKKISIKSGDLLIKGERYINRIRYIIYVYKEDSSKSSSFNTKLNKASLSLRIEAHSIGKAGQPKGRLYSIGEVCEIMDLWEASDVLTNPIEVLSYVDIQEDCVVLSKSKEKSERRKLLHICNKVIENRKIQLKLYEEESEEGDLCIEAEDVENSQEINPLRIFKQEIAEILEVSIEDLDQLWDEAASAIILEDVANLGIRMRKLPQGPTILINHIDEDNRDLKPKSIQETQIQAAIRIQKHFRAKLAKDRFKLLKLAREKERYRQILYKSGRLIDKRPYIITLFQISKGTLIQAVDQITLSLYEKLLTDPSKVIFGFNNSKNPKLIADAISIQNGHIEFYTKKSEFPKISSLTIKAIPSEPPITTKSPRYSHLPLPSSLEPKSADKPTEKMPDTPLFSPTQKLLFSSTKTISNEEWSLSIFQETFSYLIEGYRLNASLGSEVISKRFSEQELKEQYGACIDEELIFQDLIIESNEIFIRSEFDKSSGKNNLIMTGNSEDPYLNYCEEISLLILHKYLNQQKFIVNMLIRKKLGTLVDKYSGEDLLVFEAIPEENRDEKLTVRIELEEASKLAGVSIEYIIPIGRHIIIHLLTITPRGLYINPHGKQIDTDFYATRLQKMFRGSLVRKNLKVIIKEPKLIAMSYRVISGIKFLFYAYLQRNRIRLEGSSKSLNLSMHLDIELVQSCAPKIPRKTYIEKILIPSLYITIQNGVKKFSIDTPVLSKLKSAMLNGENTSGIESSRIEPDAFIILPKPVPDTTDQSYTIQEPKPDPQLFRSRKRPTSSKLSRYTDQESSMLRSYILNRELDRSNQSLQKRRENSKKVIRNGIYAESPELSRSTISRRPGSAATNKTGYLTSESVIQITMNQSEERDLIYRDSGVISKRKMIVSIYRRKTGLLIYAEDMYHELAFKKLIKFQAEANFDERMLNKTCEEIISRLYIVKNSRGKLVLKLSKEKSAAVKILYKKSHYISEKFCVVTMYEGQGGIIISAYRPDTKATHSLSLGIKNSVSKELQAKLSGLVKHLKIVSVLGSENLVFVP